MERRDIVIGAIILVLLLGGIYLLRPKNSEPLLTSPSPTPSIEDKIESSFKVNIPEDVERAEMKDVADVGGIAIATRKFATGTFTATVLADLPDPKEGFVYQAWLVEGDIKDEKSKRISLGQLRIAKGGWTTQLQSRTDYSSYKNVLISLEKKVDSTPEEHVMEGSF